jgi:hypothetical protein
VARQIVKHDQAIQFADYGLKVIQWCLELDGVTSAYQTTSLITSMKKMKVI